SITGIVEGQDGDDSFIVTTLDDISVTLSGGGGSDSDSITGADRSNTWVFTDSGVGHLNGTINFNGMEHVIGGGLDDTFSSVDRFGGSIRGGDGLDTVTVDNDLVIDFTDDSEDIFQGVVEAEVVKSLNGGSLTVRSADGVEVDWHIFNFDNATENNNKGEITYLDRDPLKFANFFNLNGGDGNDAIRFSGNSRITGTVDGDKGVNHIDVSDASNTGSYSIELGTTRNDVTLNLLN